MMLLELEWSELERICVGLFGILLLVSGARLYRYSIITPGAALGAYAGVILTAGFDESLQLAGIGLLAAVGVVLMLLVEKLAIAVLCALVGGAVTQYLLPLYFGIPIPWYGVIVGSVVGGIFFAPIFPKLLPVWMSMLGAGCVLWAMRDPTNWLWYVGLSLLGISMQLFFGAKVYDVEEE